MVLPIFCPEVRNDGASVRWYTQLNPTPYCPVLFGSMAFVPSPNFCIPARSSSVNGLENKTRHHFYTFDLLNLEYWTHK